MAMLSFGGIDVSKDRLDVMVLPEEQCSSVPNDAAGWADLVERLSGCSVAAIGIEASGGYERGVVRALLAAGMPVRQVQAPSSNDKQDQIERHWRENGARCLPAMAQRNTHIMRFRA